MNVCNDWVMLWTFVTSWSGHASWAEASCGNIALLSSMSISGPLWSKYNDCFYNIYLTADTSATKFSLMIHCHQFCHCLVIRLDRCSGSRSFSFETIGLVFRVKVISENIGLVFRVKFFWCFKKNNNFFTCSLFIIVTVGSIMLFIQLLQTLTASTPTPLLKWTGPKVWMLTAIKIPDHSISVWINQICCMIFSPLCFHLISSCAHQRGTMKHWEFFLA